MKEGNLEQDEQKYVVSRDLKLTTLLPYFHV